MRKFILLIAVISFTYSCGSFEWNAENKKAFIDSCNVDGTMEAYCECYLDQLIKDEVSLIDASTLSEDEALEIAERCFNKL